MPFSLPFYTAIPTTFAVCCLLSALVGLEYLVAVLQVSLCVCVIIRVCMCVFLSALVGLEYLVAVLQVSLCVCLSVSARVSCCPP